MVRVLFNVIWLTYAQFTVVQVQYQGHCNKVLLVFSLWTNTVVSVKTY